MFPLHQLLHLPPNSKREQMEKNLVQNQRTAPNVVLLWATLGLMGDGLVFVRAGTLEESEKILPDAHFFGRSKHPWISLPDGPRKFVTLPGKASGPLYMGEAKQGWMQQRDIRAKGAPINGSDGPREL